MSREAYFFGESYLESKFRLFGLLNYKVYDEPVRQFHNSQATALIASAPARTSKSYSGAIELVHDAFPKMVIGGNKPQPIDTGLDEKLIWMVGIDYDTIKEWDYVWSMLIERELLATMGATVTKAHNSPKQGNMQIVARWGNTTEGRPYKTILQGKSANNPRSLQGEEIATALMSEAADHDRATNEKYLSTRCGRIIYPTTPKRSGLWLYEMIQAGDTDPSLGIESFKYTRYCNPRYDHDRYERAKKKASLLFGSPENSPGFLEEFEGEWTFEGGKVLPFRWLDSAGFQSHVVETDPPWFDYAYCITSMDYGYTDPGVILFWALGPEGEVHIFDSLYEQSLSNPEFIQRGREIEKRWEIDVKQWVPDPQKPEMTKLLRQYGLPVFSGINPGKHRDRAASSMALVDLMSPNPDTGKVSFTIHSRNERVIAEWKHLRRKEDYAGDPYAAASIVGADHAFDAGRYGAMVLRRKTAPERQRSWIEEYKEARYLREMDKRYDVPVRQLYGGSDVWKR